MEEIELEIDLLADMLQALIAENARTAQDQSDYERRFREPMGRYKEKKRGRTESTERIANAESADRIIGHFIVVLWQMNETEIGFDEKLWRGLVDSITIHFEEMMKVTFKGGYKVRATE